MPSTLMPLSQILKLFFPNVRPGDTLTGGQFFAAHRLAVHAQSGKGTDRSLAFIQGRVLLVIRRLRDLIIITQLSLRT